MFPSKLSSEIAASRMQVIREISNFFLTPEGQKISLYMTTLFGSFIMYVFSFQKGFEGSISVLKRLFPQKKKVFYDRLDFFLVVISGSLVGMILFIPTNHVQAFSAGLGWVGAITMVLRSQDNEPADE